MSFCTKDDDNKFCLSHRDISNLQTLLNNNEYDISADELLLQIYGRDYKEKLRINQLFARLDNSIKINIVGSFITQDNFKEDEDSNKYILLDNEYIYSLYGKPYQIMYDEDFETIRYLDHVIFCITCNEVYKFQSWCFGCNTCKCGKIEF